jgi:MFS family permease
VIQGICVGLYSVIVPLYINEICPLELAGRFGALNQFFIVFGIFIASAIAATTEHSKINTPCPLPKDVPNTWIVVFSIPIVLAVAQILLLKFVYPKETPRYLLSIGKEYEAFDLIKEIYLE